MKQHKHLDNEHPDPIAEAHDALERLTELVKESPLIDPEGF